jgi:hypothetical protein
MNAKGDGNFVTHVEDSWFGPLSQADIDHLKKGKPPGNDRIWIRHLVPPTTSAEGPGWVVLMINDKVPVEAVGPMPSSDHAERERRARSVGVLHGSVAPLRPRGELPAPPKESSSV